MARCSALSVAGVVLYAAGYQASLKTNQTPETFKTMLYLSAFAPIVCLLIVLGMLWRYPLTEKRMNEIREQVAARKALQPTGGFPVVPLVKPDEKPPETGPST